MGWETFGRAYLDLEQMRLGARLAVHWLVAPTAESALIPQLLLQPLIENAIIHGVAPARDGGWIDIEAVDWDGGYLLVEIRNSVAGVSSPGLKVGLLNVRARLKHFYLEDAKFEFLIRSDNTAIARILVPAFANPVTA